MKVKILSPNGYKTIAINRRKAIRERCFNCSGWSHKEVQDCKFDNCQLFPFRTGKGQQSARDRAKAIRDYCQWCMAGKAGDVPKCTAKTCPLFAYRMSKVDRSIEIIKKSVVNA